MVGHELAIQQLESADVQAGHQPRQCNFGRIAATGEHAFTAKGTTNRQTIEAADQPVLAGRFIHLPAFDAMGMAKLVQLHERLLDFGIYPGFLAIGGLRGANIDHIGKGGIGGDPKAVGPDGLAERTRHLEIVQRNDRPGFWFHPENIGIVTRVRHREYARRISFQQQVEINGHGH